MFSLGHEECINIGIFDSDVIGNYTIIIISLGKFIETSSFPELNCKEHVLRTVSISVVNLTSTNIKRTVLSSVTTGLTTKEVRTMWLNLLPVCLRFKTLNRTDNFHHVRSQPVGRYHGSVMFQNLTRQDGILVLSCFKFIDKVVQITLHSKK